MSSQRPPRNDTAAMDEASRIANVTAAFEARFGATPDFVARAPGRVNLIGEHTDYNGGFVLPVAIDRTVLIAARGVEGSTEVEVASVNFGSEAKFDLAAIEPTGDKKVRWSNYVRAVAWALLDGGLIERDKLAGAQLAIEGNVPTGAGLSSSAAIEVASAIVFAQLAGARGLLEDRATLARACQRAENEFIGVKSGIMDQFISALGQVDSALLIDTRSLEYEVVPLGFDEIGYRIVAVDSAVPRSLITSAYNERTAECSRAMQILGPLLGLPGGAQLRDVAPTELEQHKSALPELLYRRARHVVSEDERTLRAAELMRAGLGSGDNLRAFGQLLYASHASLRDDYEVSSKELDLLVELASQTAGVVGGRMTGAGFGGCTVNIVEAAALHDFEQAVVGKYREMTGLDARLHVCKAVNGGSIV